MTTEFNFLGIPGTPKAARNVLKGSIYASVLDSVPAHTSLMVQALKSNLTAGIPSVLVTKIPLGEFLRMAEILGADFREDISQSRLYLFSREEDFAANIFRRGIDRFLDEFDYFGVPNGSFFLFDQAWEQFTLAEQDLAQSQASDYLHWMKSAGNTSLFLFPARDEHIPQSILGCFNGVARITQSKTAIEFLIDFWYSEDGAVAARAYPLSFEPNGLIRIDKAYERSTDAEAAAPSRQIALTPALSVVRRAESVRQHRSEQEMHFHPLIRTPDAADDSGERETHHSRDET